MSKSEPSSLLVAGNEPGTFSCGRGSSPAGPVGRRQSRGSGNEVASRMIMHDTKSSTCVQVTRQRTP